jgi:RNA polymerase sigma factor (sigma-70 family)
VVALLDLKGGDRYAVPGNPKLAVLRRRYIKRLERARKRENTEVVTRRGFFTVLDQDEIIERWQDRIGKIASKAIGDGLPTYIEKDDLRQALNLAVLDALGRYKPVPGVYIDAYISKCLSFTTSTGKPGGAIVDIIKRENGWRTDLDKHILGELYFGPGVTRPRSAPDGGFAGKRHGLQNTLSEGKQESVVSLPAKKVGLPSNVREIQRNMRIDVRTAIAGLDRTERRAVRMYYFDGHTQPEIAATLHCSQSWVSETLLPNALAHLRENLTAYQNYI